ncbi:MAG: Hsp70 family protein [Selenomonadaceae bacterium]|nr:Hsp70 family protein [Selenomonadaceae bacterium]
MNINGEEHNDLCVGIDLGTTNSVLATVNVRLNGNIVSKVVNLDRAVDMFNFGQGSKFTLKKAPILPSCVYYNDEKNYQPIVGDFAKGRYPLRPYLVAKSIKSQMGNEFAEGLSSNIPDKTPAEVSARILEHMLRNAAKIYHLERIDDAVITVPANFDFIMRQATLRAAEIAGIKIRKADGSPRQILLSEPRAVIYDFINQVHNGEIAEQILDLSSKKNVMVFDLGGGTLDITLHEISRREDAPEILNVKDISTNRYTLLGGDDFDLCLAQEMFRHYLEQYNAHPEIIQKIRHEEKGVMSQLLNYAENLKLEVSAQKSDALGSDDSDWWNQAEDFPVGGNIGTTGYAYSDSFSTTELEDIWRDFMGENLTFNDFKNLNAAYEKSGNRKNIIMPILDVLAKAADKLGSENVRVDAVIMNGGMSRFYMVINRLKEFFGFEPIVALDPDQAVARGAAVYHYFLHKYDKELADEVKDELPRAVNQNNSAPKENFNRNIQPSSFSQPPRRNTSANRNITAADRSIGVVFGSNILNESLYLVTFGGNYEEIIPAGKELPYTSARFTGYRLPPGKNVIGVPIARQMADNTYRIIAKGNIEFPERYARMREDAFVTFSIFMDEDKIIHMNAATCRDERGLEIMDHGTTTISIATSIDKASGEKGYKGKLINPLGRRLNPRMQLNTIRSLCYNVDEAFRRHNKEGNIKYSATLKLNVNMIIAATNHRDFAEPLLQMLDDIKNSREESLKLRCIIIARKIGASWTPQQKRRLARLCMYQLDEELYNPGINLGRSPGLKMNTKIQAIYTLSMCGSDDDIKMLINLHNNEKFRMANLYTHAVTKTEIDWIYSEFKRDCDKILSGAPNSSIQISAHAMGAALKLDGRPIVSSVKREQVVSDLCKIIRSRNMNHVEISVCLLAIGLICDRRGNNTLQTDGFAAAEKLLNELYCIYDENFVEMFAKAQDVAKKMIQGGELTAEEEESLLMKWAT